MEVTYLPGSCPAATLVELEKDWSEMTSLEVDVTLDESYPQEGLQLMVQVIDGAHSTADADTYRGEWTLAPGKPKHIVISRDAIVTGPDDREIDLSSIRFVDLMVLNPEVITKLRVDNLRVVQ